MTATMRCRSRRLLTKPLRGAKLQQLPSVVRPRCSMPRRQSSRTRASREQPQGMRGGTLGRHVRMSKPLSQDRSSRPSQFFSFPRNAGLATLALLFAFACSVSAQLTGKGAITGTVTDTTGAVIPDAQLTATNLATGIQASTQSTGTGNFTFSNLDPGIYSVTTTAKGFSKLVQENIHVNAMESQTYDPVLTVGATTQEITVTAQP